MNIPQLYSSILEKDKKLKGAVYTTLELFSEILNENKLYFFEEYTDHGIRHIEAVLATSINLLTEDSLSDFMDSTNVTALVLSILAHDLGMHHSFSSFRKLVQQDTILIPEIDQCSWKELWSLYISEAKKFTSQQKKDIFGEYDYVIQSPDFSNINKIDGYQKKLIGEFIRRHHTRMAHEIALFGFDSGDNVLKFADGLNKEQLDLVGIISRSHGMDIRSTYQYINNKFYRANKAPYNIHVYYLMTIVRLADYFQIDIQRLLVNAIKFRTFSSPISKIEHEKHLAIREISVTDDDPETLFVRAYPENNLVYCKLLDLITSIQLEIDTSWAIIGEKYGKDKIRPTIRYRRIISNLTDDNYLKTIKFLPEKITFSASPELPKLLVDPLYGRNPSFGIRELIQNATDAIHERLFLDKTFNDKDAIIDVKISHNANLEYFFEITDNGKGMNIQEIKNYFLIAGATNRKSEEWDKQYVDINGNTQILKSGKFGVGVLAAFLIGYDIDVITKRYDLNYALKFSLNIHSQEIEVEKIDSNKVGTTLRIKIKDESLEQLKVSTTDVIEWHKWYTLQKPVINYSSVLSNSKLGLSNVEQEPSFNDKDLNWVEFTCQGFTKLRWAYDSNKKSQLYRLTCNGIIIPNPPKPMINSFRTPNIQVFDFNGILPLTLNRNSLAINKLPFEEELLNSIFKQVLIKILDTEPSIKITDNTITYSGYNNYPTLMGGLKVEEFFAGFVYTNKGYYINNKYLTQMLMGYNHVRLYTLFNQEFQTLNISLSDNFTLDIVRFENLKSLNSYTEYNSSFLKSTIWAMFKKNIYGTINLTLNTEYKSEEIDLHGKKIVTIKHFSIKKAPIYIGRLSESELEKISSIIIYSKPFRSLHELNNAFNFYISNIFSQIKDPIIPYDKDLRYDKINELKSIINSY